MIMEEEALRRRIRADIITSQKQLETLSLELSVEPYKVIPVKYCNIII